jgi:hypothetical protein
MGTLVPKWAMQCLAWGSMLHNVEAMKLFVDILNKQSHIAADTPLQKTQKHEQFHTCFIVTVGQFAK